jgi:Neurotransmitter-gated ion-channel ligand binding domain
MTRRLLPALFLAAALLLMMGLLVRAEPTAAQEPPGRAQRITDRLQAGESHAYLLKDLQAGDRLAVSMRATSGNLDPALGILDTATPLLDVMTRFQAEIRRIVAENEDVGPALNDLRNRTFLAWDDDGGEGYAAALEYTVPASGDYVLIAGASLSALGRATSGDYELLIGLNAPAAGAGAAAPAGPPIAERIPSPWGLAASVQEVTGTLTAAAPKAALALADIDAGSTLTAHVETTSGNLIPILILRDYGGKPLEAGNLGGLEPQATLQYTMTEPAAGYSLDVQAEALPDGTATEGDYRLLLGLNAPEILTGQAQPQGNPILKAPIEVQSGLKILRISAVDSPNENFTVLASLRMDWTDPALAFSPDSCNCSVKLYSDKEVDRFLAEVGSRWPAFTFFNQLGNRWIGSRAAAIWPDGRARYAESFNTTFQADFDFRQYPFDTQTFPVFLDLVYPTSLYTMTELPGYSEIDPAHGEDEFIISELAVTPSAEMPSAADTPVSRLTFSFSAPRHMNYYLLQVFLPIILIILISWFTFFLRDYTRRIEAAAANILLFIAFSWSLAGNYPRLGYVTFLDAIMAVTFAVNVLVLLYNVYMKRLETQGKDERVQRIDNVLDWAYPLAYAVLIGGVVLLFF